MKRQLTILSEWGVYFMVMGITLLTLFPKIYRDTYLEWVSFGLGILLVMIGTLFIADREKTK